MRPSNSLRVKIVKDYVKRISVSLDVPVDDISKQIISDLFETHNDVEGKKVVESINSIARDLELKSKKYNIEDYKLYPESLSYGCSFVGNLKDPSGSEIYYEVIPFHDHDNNDHESMSLPYSVMISLSDESFRNSSTYVEFISRLRKSVNEISTIPSKWEVID